MAKSLRLLVLATVLASASFLAHGADLPTAQLNFLDRYCLECHDTDTAKGDLSLDHVKVDWSAASVRAEWEGIYLMLSRKMMPPDDSDQPSDKERADMLAWMDQQLMAHSPIGGTPVRPLNRREYINTLESLFDLKGFEIPAGLPQDNESHGFDTIGGALVISPSHVEAYTEAARELADYLIPPIQKAGEPRTWKVPPKDMVISYSAASVVDGAMRLASTGSKVRNATWPSKFEAPLSGTYRVELSLSVKNPPDGHSPQFVLAAHKNQGKSERVLSTFTVKPGAAQTFSAEVDLFRGENVLFRYANAPMNFEDKSFGEFMKNEFIREPRLPAAWVKAAAMAGKRRVPPGRDGWKLVQKAMQDPSLDLEKFKPGSKAVEGLIRRHFGGKARDSGETLIYKYFAEGPNLGIHEVSVTGPTKLIEDDEMRRRKAIQQKFIGKPLAATDTEALKAFLAGYLGKVFRRPATDVEVDTYHGLVQQEVGDGLRVEDGLHLAVRTSLLSPNFLYRERGDGELDPYELASRLSYFLTSGPPDQALLKRAAAGNLSDSTVLRAEVARLLGDKPSLQAFAHDFTSQWLDTDLLDNLMPDPALFKDFSDTHRAAMKGEVEKSFQEVLVQNKPVSDLIDPDFIYTDKEIGTKIYQFRKAAKAKSLQRFTIPRGTKMGGILGMPAVMMATANGVDTQPVLRGVWLMENVLGTPPPEPPKGVPALPPDTADAIGPRAKLKAHMADASCARCHREIDPLGFVLENFDAIGKWRTHYPGKPKQKGPVVDASGTLPDGSALKDVTDLKRFLIEHPEYFSRCISEKLLTYASGRSLNYREKAVIDQIVASNLAAGNPFKDLLMDLVDSDVFRAR
jgi:hypothetical protein